VEAERRRRCIAYYNLHVIIHSQQTDGIVHEVSHKQKRESLVVHYIRLTAETMLAMRRGRAQLATTSVRNDNIQHVYIGLFRHIYSI